MARHDHENVAPTAQGTFTSIEHNICTGAGYTGTVAATAKFKATAPDKGTITVSMKVKSPTGCTVKLSKVNGTFESGTLEFQKETIPTKTGHGCPGNASKASVGFVYVASEEPHLPKFQYGVDRYTVTP